MNSDTAIASAASKVSFTGVSSIGYGWLMTNEFAVVMGILIGIGGLLVNWYYRAKEDRRAEANHQFRMQDKGPV